MSHPVLLGWLAAIRKGDCVELMRLLQESPDLLKQGWKENPAKFSGGGGTGRSALHVAVSRGCLQLVKQILEIFDDDDDDFHEADEDEDGSSMSSEGNSDPVLPAEIHENGVREGFRENGIGGEFHGNGVREEFHSITSIRRKPDFSLEDLLAAFDGVYELDAFSMAVFNGYQEIVGLLIAAMLRHDIDVYNTVTVDWTVLYSFPTAGVFTSAEDDRRRLRLITEDVLASRSLPEINFVKRVYAADCDFNFLPWQEYLFHFTFHFRHYEEWQAAALAANIGVEIIEGAAKISRSCLHFLLTLCDGQGRTALHFAVKCRTVVHFLKRIPEGSGYDYVLNVRDAAGRTPLHCAVAGVFGDTLQHLLQGPGIDLNATFRVNRFHEGLFLAKVSARNGLGSQIPYEYSVLHLAIVKQDVNAVRLLLAARGRENGASRSTPAIDPNTPFVLEVGFQEFKQMTTMELAVRMGNLQILQLLVKDSRVHDAGLYGREIKFYETPGLHVAVSTGNMGAVKMFLDSPHFDPLVCDERGNTALHVATRDSEMVFEPSIINFVNMWDVHRWKGRGLIPRHVYRDSNGGRPSQYGHRKGIINLLLQAGIDIWQPNGQNEGPDPSLDAPEEFVTWWYERKSRESLDLQSRLNVAANAISLIAALVATASYVGPLQPPLGLDSDTGRMRVGQRSVEIFIICDTLSFYLGVAAIIFAVIPSIPLPQESTLDELTRTRKIVALAIGCLLPSIICVLVAFAAGSIAVIPDGHNGSWNYGGLTASTMSVGGSICLVGVILFYIRLLRLIFYKNLIIRKLYKLTTF